MRSKVVDKLLKEMENDPWHIKLRRSIRIQLWIWKCLSRKYWDKSFSGYIFRNKNEQNKEESIY